MSTDPLDPTSLRIGQGFDVHPWVDDPGRPLMLGGIEFKSDLALRGHSDSDVIAHACVDALLGAAGLGDIGEMFSDQDPALQGADSIEMLRVATARLIEHGFHPINIDCTVVLDRPKLAPRRAEMQERLSTAVGAPVTVKGKRSEQLSSLSDGARCWAVALVRLI